MYWLYLTDNRQLIYHQYVSQFCFRSCTAHFSFLLSHRTLDCSTFSHFKIYQRAERVREIHLHYNKAVVDSCLTVSPWWTDPLEPNSRSRDRRKSLLASECVQLVGIMVWHEAETCQVKIREAKGNRALCLVLVAVFLQCCIFGLLIQTLTLMLVGYMFWLLY